MYDAMQPWQGSSWKNKGNKDSYEVQWKIILSLLFFKREDFCYYAVIMTYHAKQEISQYL